MLAAMSQAQHGSRDLARSALQLLALGALLVTSLWIVRPFLIAGLWAVMIAVATWPLLERTQALLAGHRGLATGLLTLLLLLILVIPMYLGISAVVESADDIASLSETLAGWTPPQPPDWVERLPLVGGKVASEWRALAAEGPEGLAARVTPYARDIAKWLVSEIGSIGMVVVQFLLTVIFTAILYSTGETAARFADRFARRLAGPQGGEAIRLAAQATRAVALGVIVTALVQSGLVGIGLGIAGVPFAAILTALAFILAVAQIGPLPILIAAVIWVYTQHGGVWGTVFLVWAGFCGTIDNFLRPVLIQRTADLPLLLIFVGVVGGLFAFGVVGLFIGPVVLAVSYMLLGDWMEQGSA
jgi:predicted PurR-regulated permease PerM